MAAIKSLWSRGKAIPWAVVWEIGRSLWTNARDQVNENLSASERREFGKLVRKGRKARNLSATERRRLVALVKKAATGDTESGWDEVGRSLMGLLPPRIIGEVLSRRSH